MVKDILVDWMAAPFAGRCRKAGLGRSVECERFLLSNDAPMTADVRRTPRRGTPSACATKRMHSRQAREIVACSTRTRPSLGPSARARQSSLCTRRKSGGGASVRASRLGKPGEPGRTSTGARTNGRSAARRVSLLPQGSGVAREEKEEGRGLRPCEDQRVSGLVARTSRSAIAEVDRRRSGLE